MQKDLDISIVDQIVAEFGSYSHALIPILQKTQATLGYLPKQIIEHIAYALHVPVSTVYGVVTFYAQFRLTPVGKHIVRVCHGTACHVAGADRITQALNQKLGIQDNETTDDGLFTMKSVACLGCCSLAPVIMIEDKTFGRLDRDKIDKIIDDYRQNKQM